MDTTRERLRLTAPGGGRRWMILSVLLLALVGIGVVGTGAVLAQEADQRADRPAEEAMTVRLIVDYNNGAQRVYTRLGWTKGMTVLEALRQASEHPQGFKLDSRGRGETAFVTGIDGVANERGGGEARNWLYWVNTEFATRGAGVQELQSGDVVLWKYQPWNAGR